MAVIHKASTSATTCVGIKYRFVQSVFTILPLDETNQAKLHSRSSFCRRALKAFAKTRPTEQLNVTTFPFLLTITNQHLHSRRWRHQSS